MDSRRITGNGRGAVLEQLEPRLLLAADVVISEIMYQDLTNVGIGLPEDPGEEFIELYNRGDAPADLLDWKITNGVDFVFPDVTLGAGEYLVVPADPAVFATNYPAVTNYVNAGWTGKLSNSGETIKLENELGVTMDMVDYADEGDWAVRQWVPDIASTFGYGWSNLHDGGGHTLEVINPAMTNNSGHNWSASLAPDGTPGSVNSVFAADIAPLIRNVGHTPIIPTASDAVTVVAKVQDESLNGLVVELLYRDDGDPDFSVADMYDDGLHNDDDPGDGIYGAELPARPDGTIVEFYVRATDENLNSRNWPAPVTGKGQTANALYQVDDSFSENWTPGDQPVFRAILTAQEWLELDAMEDSSTTRRSNAQRNATFVSTDGVDTDVRYQTGMRNRGNGSRSTDPHNQRFNIPHDTPWEGYQAVTINARVPQSQSIGSAVFRFADIVAIDTIPVELQINGINYAPGSRYYMYNWLEPLDSDMVANHWPDDSSGNLYKNNDSNGGGTEANFDYHGENPDFYNVAYAKQTNVAADDYSGLIHMLDVLNNAPAETYMQDVAEVVNIEQWLRFLAVDTLLANGEGGLTSGRGDDYAMYEGVIDPRFELVPYDLDTVLGTGTQSQITDSIWDYRVPGLHGLNRLLSQPETIQMYYATLLELCDTVFSPEQLDPLIDTVLGGWVTAGEVADIKQFAVDRVANVRTQVANDVLSASSTLPLSGDYHRTTNGTVGLSGTASGAYVRSVMVDDRIAVWDQNNGTWFFDDGSSTYQEQVLISSDSAITYHIPTTGEDPLAWTAPAFDDSGWIDSISLNIAGLLITELSTGDTKFVELQNVSDAAVDTTGWQVLLNDASSGINAVNSTSWSLPGSVTAGELLYQTDSAADNFWGASIDWAAEGPGWTMIIDAAGAVQDFVAWGYTAVEIAALDIAFGGFASITVGDQWSGDGAAVGTVGPGPEAPTVDITDITPDPHNTAVDVIEFVFSKAVVNFDIGDLVLTHDGGANLLTGESLTSGDGGVTWTLSGLTGLTNVSGTYVITLTAAGSGIEDTETIPLALVVGASDSWDSDLIAPTADIIDVTPDSISAPVDSVQIVFSEVVSGLDVGDFDLTLDGGLDLLTGAETLITGDDVTWTLGGLGALTTVEGTYTLTLTAVGSSIIDGAGNPLVGDALDSWQTVGVPPTADIIDVDPDPRNDAVDSIDIVFSEAVTGLDILDLDLTLDGGADLLTAESLTTSDNITWTLGGLAALTAADGTYALTLTAAGSNIQDAASNALAGDASDSWAKFTQVGGWVAFNDHVAGAGTHANTTAYNANATAGGELKDIVSGLGVGAILTTSHSSAVFDNNGANPASGTDAFNIFDGYVDFSAATGTSIEIDGAASYTHTFSSLDTGSSFTYEFDGTMIRGNAPYNNRWTTVTLVGADASTGAHSLGVGVVVLSPTSVAIMVGSNHQPGEGFVAGWTGIDPGADGEFQIVSTHYTGATPGVGTGTADGTKSYAVGGIRLTEIQVAPAPPAPDNAPIPAGAPGDGFVAFNDHLAGGGTHPNTTLYSARAGSPGSGFLKDIATGADTSVTLAVTASGVNYADAQGNPAPGTDAYNMFDGYVDFGSVSGASIETAGADIYTYTFSGLDLGADITYNFHGTAIRSNSAYVNRWTLVTLVGADGFIPAPSSGDGVITTAFNPSIAANQMVLWTGDNSQVGQGYVAGWTEIDPGSDGIFAVTSQQYTGVVPTSINPVGVADGNKCYSLSGVRLEEVPPLGPQSWLTRTGDTDTDTDDDFNRSASDSKGVQNPGMTVPFGSVIPTLQGIGFSDDQVEFDSVIATDVGDAMQGVNGSLFSRMEFTAGSLAGYDKLTLDMKYDDGFIAYINGVEVARHNADNPLAWNTVASAQQDNAQAVIFEEIDISEHLGLGTIVQGVNVLAIHSMNTTAADGDLLMQTELKVSRGDPQPGLELQPGLNRIQIEAFSGPNGTGELIDSTHVDVWNDTGPTNIYPLAVGGGAVSVPTDAQLIVRDSYLPGTPVLVRVEARDANGDVCRDLWDATAILTADNGVQLDVSAITMYNGVGSALITFTGGTGDFNLTATIGALQDSDDLTDLTGAPITSVSGTLADVSGVDTWSGIMHVTGDVLVPTGHTLNIQPGTLVLLDGDPTARSTTGIDIDVQGTINSLGTEDSPVSFTAFVDGAPWGEFHHASAAPSLYQYTHITQGGHSPGGGHTGHGPVFRPTGSTIVFDYVTISDNRGKVMQSSSGSDMTFRDSIMARSVSGPEIDNTALLMEDTYITEMLGIYREDGTVDDDDGIYIHGQGAGQDVTMRGGIIANTDDDGLDTLHATVLVEDYIFRDMFDKGSSVFGGEVTYNGLISADNDIGISAKDGSSAVVHIDHATITGNTWGIQAENKGGGMDGAVIEYYITNSIIYGNSEWGVRSDYDLGDITIDYSIVGTNWISDGGYRGIPDEIHTGEIWPGTSNQNADPLFANPAAGSFHLQAGSPAALAGNDGKDLGYYGDAGPVIPPDGELDGDTIWRPEDGVYRIAGDLTVPAAYTLTIMPGTTVFFGQDAQLIVEGRLVAEGLPEAKIRFASASTASDWEGIHFVSTTADNRITHAILQGSTRTDGMVDVDNSRLTVENSVFEDAGRRRITAIGSSLIVRNSTFADFDVVGTPSNNVLEHLWGRNVMPGGEMILEGNTFGLTPGHNDAVDFDAGHRLGEDPVPQVLNNTFLGGGDDALDIEGDFYVQGNTFMHYRKDAWHDAVDSGESNILSAGDAHNVGHHYVVTGNVFYDSDHVTLVKESSFMTFTNNTVVKVDQGQYASAAGAINFDFEVAEPEGEGAYLDGNVFVDTPVIFNNMDTGAVATDLTVNRSILPVGEHHGGVGNIDADARLTDPAGGDFLLKPGSPAFGTGPVGIDMGADVPAGAAVSPVPLGQTYLTSATFDVSGDADYRHAAFLSYKYRLNGAAWSAEQAPGTQIALAGLSDGPQLLEVISQNFAGVWQDQADAVARMWMVDTSLSRVLINEVLATNRTAHIHDLRSLDVIELYNDSESATIDISGWSITDNVDLPLKYVFGPGTTIAADSYLTLYAGVADLGATGIYVGFQLDGDGDDIYLYDGSQTLVDSIAFGMQIADMSIGRTGPDRTWTLNQPTIGAANIAQPTVDPDGLVLNEWFANGDEVLIDDFVELYNPNTLPAHLVGVHLTDNPANQKTKHQIAPLSFIDAEGFVALQADNRNDAGHVDFALRSVMEILGLFDADVNQLDRMYYGAQTEDVSQGRTPDGSANTEYSTLPTPDVGNVAMGVGETIMAESNGKYVLVPDAGTVTTWPAVDFVTYPGVGFDTTGWTYWDGSPYGVGFDSGDGAYLPLIGVDVIAMDNVNSSVYIAYAFSYAGDPNQLSSLSLDIRYDDGFIAYLNGVEIHREMFEPASIPAWDSSATGIHDDVLALDLASFDIMDHVGALNTGANVLAIHGLNESVGSSDLIMSAQITGTAPGAFANLLAVHNDLRITEVMYNPSGSDNKEFIEFQNVGTLTLDLTGVRLSDGIDFVFPAVTLAPDEYIVVARDLVEFEAFYGSGLNAIGDYAGSLSNAGEDILLQMPDPYEAAILRFDYNDAWYPATDGDGASLVIVDSLGRRGDWDPAEGWKPSTTTGGSPGVSEPIPDHPLGSVVINELLAHSDGGVEDWIEVHNTTGADIDISGWFLSDDPADLEKFVIPGDPSLPFEPGNTILVAGGYMVFDEVNDFGTEFALSEHGDDVVLSSCDITGALSTYRAFVSFDANANGVTLGRHTLSTGEVDFVAMQSPTFEGFNSGPLVGSVVIEEIMYNPDGPGGTEYILMKNISGTAVDLFDPANPTNTWQISGGVDFVFPEGVTVQPGEFVLITSVLPATYLASHTVGASVTVLGPFDLGALSNGGDTITVSVPGTPETGPVFTPYIPIETIKYNDSLPWPEAPDGDGPALSKLQGSLDQYGNDPINWGASGGPTITIDSLTTDDQTPEITGTATDVHPPATVTVTVDGTDYVVPVVGGVWTLPDNTITTPLAAGLHDVAVSAIDTVVGNVGTDITTDELFIDIAVGVVARHVFYNNSAWDTVDDDAAIDPSKTPLMPGGTAGPANSTSYSLGINGIMVDIDSLTADPTAGDFVLRVNQAAAPDTWSAAPAPASITRSVGTGVGGSDRVTIIWSDGAILNQWVEVTVLATGVTGLASSDVFYYGNAVGDNDGDGAVDDTEYIAFKSQFSQRGPMGTLASDYNGDGRVSMGDFIALRERFGAPGVQAPTLPAPAPAAAAAPAPGDGALIGAPTPGPTPGATPGDADLIVVDDVWILGVPDVFVDLFVEAQPAPTPLDSPALMAATTESELQPLSDDLVPQDGTDDLLTDILAESVLAGPLL